MVRAILYRDSRGRVLFFAGHELKTTGSAKIVTAELRKIASARIEAGT